MRILITGVHGFVGSNLVEYLKDRHEIYGVDIVAPEKDGVVKTYSWDDMDAGILPETDAIVALAGLAHDTKNHELQAAYFKVNTELTIKSYEYFLRSGARKFIFFSSAKAAADTVEGVLTEDIVPCPVGPYGESKIKAEEYIGAHPAEDKDVYILRPCMIHGPGNKGNLNLLYNFVSKGVPWPLGAWDNRRTFTSVENICFVVEGLLCGSAASGVYNMGDDETFSTNELIRLICSRMGKKARIWKLPRGLMRFAAKAGGRLHLPLDPGSLKKLTENYVSSNAKIKAALGIDSLPVNARDGLIRTIDSFVNNK